MWKPFITVADYDIRTIIVNGTSNCEKVNKNGLEKMGNNIQYINSNPLLMCSLWYNCMLGISCVAIFFSSHRLIASQTEYFS